MSLLIVGVLVGVGVAWLVLSGRPKRFGLDAAAGALEYAEKAATALDGIVNQAPDPAAARKAVVKATAMSIVGGAVGVLGYENTVVAELGALREGVEAAAEARERKAARHERAIARRRGKVAALNAATREDRATVARGSNIAEIFG